MQLTYRVVLYTLILILGLAWLKDDLAQVVQRNQAKLAVSQTWMDIDYQEAPSDDLQDNIPDQWDVSWWGGATQIYRLESRSGLAGDQAVYVERTNNLGVAVITQDVIVLPQTDYVFSVYAKGQGGAIQVKFRLPGQDWDTLDKSGWVEIPPSSAWHQYRLVISVPPSAQEARLLLRASGSMWFDDVYVGTDKGNNLLKNSGFEQDGRNEDPLVWWQNSMVFSGSDANWNAQLDGLAYLNIADMLDGHYDTIRQRSQQLGEGCASAPEMTAWLIARDGDFERMGGAAAREKLYQLAIALAPNCPQSYAALAELYKSHSAFGPASALYHQASELAHGSVLEGLYAFEEGFLEIRYTGDLEHAVQALQLAERISGWEPGKWYWGAASLFRGQALEAQGRLTEATAAYQRVLACKKCAYHFQVAQERLAIISVGKQTK